MKAIPPSEKTIRDAWAMQHALALDSHMAPAIWFNKSNSLISAFVVLTANDAQRDKLNRPRRIQSVAFLVAGFAIECLLKGRLIALRKHRDKNTGKFSIGIHNLRALAHAAGYRLSAHHQIILESLEAYAVWNGRYPVPKRYEDMVSRDGPNGAFMPLAMHITTADIPEILKLFVRFRKGLLKAGRLKVQQADLPDY